MPRVKYEYVFENLTEEWLAEAARVIERLECLAKKHEATDSPS